MTNIAVRFLPPLVVIAAFATAAVMLSPSDPPPPPLQISIVEYPRPSPLATALDDVHTSVESCIVEYDARAPGNLDMLVRLHVDPDGRTRASTFSGPDHAPLRACVDAALRRMAYPTGDHVWIDLFVRWRDRWLEMTPTVTKPMTWLFDGELRDSLDSSLRDPPSPAELAEIRRAKRKLEAAWRRRHK